jgi:hypothetical protein
LSVFSTTANPLSARLKLLRPCRTISAVFSCVVGVVIPRLMVWAFCASTASAHGMHGPCRVMGHARQVYFMHRRVEQLHRDSSSTITPPTHAKQDDTQKVELSRTTHRHESTPNRNQTAGTAAGARSSTEGEGSPRYVEVGIASTYTGVDGAPPLNP